MTKRFLTVQEALEYFETIDSDEYSDDGSIICLPPDPAVVTDEEDVAENDIILNSDFPKDVCGEIELSMKKKEKAKVLSRLKCKRKRRINSDKKEDNDTDEEDSTESNTLDADVPEDLCEKFEKSVSKKQKRKVALSLKSKKRKRMNSNQNEANVKPDKSPNYNIANKKEKEIKRNFNWKSSNLLPINSEKLSKLEETFPELITKTPYELFNMFFDNEVMNYLIEETQRYALQNNVSGFLLSEKEIKKFLAIILFSGYHSLPQEELYWSNSPDCNIPFIQNAMSRQRFRDIKKFLHLCNNDTIDKTDKLAKVRRFLEMFCEKLQQFGAFSECLSVDEEMIPYTGHHSAKMYMRGKPIKFGYKLWILATSEGYPLNLQVYVGKNTILSDGERINEAKPLGTRVVLDLVECIDNPRRHKIYMDNFFTSLELLEEMRKREFRVTGTIRENRLKDCPLSNSKLLAKLERGNYEAIATQHLSVVKWKDNKIVCLASNFETEAPLGKVKRWCTREKKKVDLSQPQLVASYNKYMGGVDLLDRFLSNYRPRIKGKKWWWPFFTNTLNMAVVAAWRLHKELKGEMSQLEFLRDITTALIKSDNEENEKPRLGPHGLVNSSVRFDGINHFIVSAEKQSRCKFCKKNTRMRCKKCDVMLHQGCSSIFHKKK